MRFAKRSFVTALAVTSLTFVAGIAAALGPATGAEVKFKGKTLGFTVEGVTNELQVSEKEGKVSFVVPLGKLSTGIAMRDDHMKNKYLEVGKYPNAVLVVDKQALKLAGGEGKVDGDMTIHGQTKRVSVSYNAKKNGASYDISGATVVNIKEFGIDAPTYKGIAVKPDVEVFLKAQIAE